MYESNTLDPSTPTYVLSNLLELNVDTTTLSTTLLGYDAYSSQFAHDDVARTYCHISSQLPTGYRREWGGLEIIGGGVEAGYAGSPLVTLSCRTDGQVLTERLQPTSLGLQALTGVGRTRARQLRDAGFTSRERIATTDIATLAAVRGFGRLTAERVQQSAQAIANNEVVRTTEKPLPSGKPVYIDIETDGLSPTITWLIGVLDGSSADGEYLSFLQTDPDEPAGALEEFMHWYTTTASHRPLVAYNGWQFDFDVIQDHIIEYCPQYETDWTSIYRFDPYQWAVKDGNAILPGRTNKLEDVATALGYEPMAEEITGEMVARIYQQWMTNQSSATEPEWNTFEIYCEDDVRGLATVYEALKASSRIVSTDAPSRDTGASTTQGQLSDW
ncbi:DNA repair and recombination protein RadA [Halalkalicoccus paucihalophilus]|uniref:DNA repair and recombination protein RadA n=1 Tax=Halalkalicoccus paucihalophilus TaxID=1008153 RepID=A0A151AB35_9EURY|nr:DNA repair and recombination protein RadA [Halalkalicoccus paucihalophilus]